MEVEFKFQVPANRRDAVEADLRLGPAKRTRLRARYFDTAQGALAAHRVVLRLRLEGRQWVQTVKAAGRGPLDRLEHNVELGAGSDLASAVPDVQRHAGTAVGKQLAEILAQSGEPLVELYATDIWRLVRREQESGTAVELAFDTGRIIVPGQGSGKPRTTRICELELELLDGPVQGLIDMAQHWSQRHGLWLSTVSKAAHGERLLAGVDCVPAIKAVPPVFAGEPADRPTGPAVQQAVVTACLAQVLPNASEIAAGSEDAEQIHQLRVGLRRLRTALRELDPLGPGFDPAWQAPLAEAFQALGAQRDRETVLNAVVPRLAAAGAPPVVLSADAATAPSPGEAVRAASFQAVLVALIGLVTQHVDGETGQGAPSEQTQKNADEPSLSGRQTRRYLRSRLRKLHAHVVHDGQRFESLTHEEQHRVRKRLKRLRYLAEFVAPLFDEDKVRHYLDRLEPAQDALGHFNDDIVALHVYREAVAEDPRAWFAVGWLNALQAAGARDCMKSLRRIERATPFW